MLRGTLRRLLPVALGMAMTALAAADPSDDLAGPSEGGRTAVDKDSDFSNVEIVDAALEGKVELVRVGSRRGENGLLGVFAGLKNKTAHRLSLEVETIYKDKSGNELNTGSWIRFNIAPREQGDYRSSAISQEAVDFIVRVRRVPAGK